MWQVDRWLVSGTLPEGQRQMRMANYMSIGVDAKAALLWARMARAVPLLFRLLLLNKLWCLATVHPPPSELAQHVAHSLAHCAKHRRRLLTARTLDASAPATGLP